MKNAVLALLWLVPVISGAQEDKPFDDRTSSETSAQEDDLFKVFPDPDGTDYFPKRSSSHYTYCLSAMKEPPLQRKLKEGEDFLFRFTYLRSFDDPLMVRVTKIGDTLKMRSVILRIGDDYKPVKILHDENLSFDAKEAKSILSKLNSKIFWKPLNDAERFCEGLDGSRWVFEIRDKNGYRMIDPWSPGSNVVPDDVDLPKMLKESGLKVEKVRNYDIYVDVGYGLLRMADILPESDLQY